MTFDEKLKARAAREGSPIPEGFDSRMDALLDTLPAEVQPAKKRRAPRLAVCIGHRGGDGGRRGGCAHCA